MEVNFSAADSKEVDNLWQQEFNGHLLPSAVYLFLLLGSGVFGNAFVFIVYQIKLKTTESRLFIPYLACTDFAACVTTTVFFITDIQYYVNFPSHIMCKVFNFFTFFFIMASLLLQLSIAISRYIKICHPQRNFNYLRFEKITIVGVFIGSALFATPSVFVSNIKKYDVIYKQHNITGCTCQSLAGNDPLREVVRMLLVSVIITGIIVSCCVLHSKIGIVIHRTFPGKDPGLKTKTLSNDQEFASVESTSCTLSMSRHVTASALSLQTRLNDERSTNSKRKLRHQHRRRMNFNIMFITMLVAYTVAWAPFIGVMLFSVFLNDIWTNKTFMGLDINFYLIARSFFITSYSANPIIYSLFDSKFRRTVQKLLHVHR